MYIGCTRLVDHHGCVTIVCQSGALSMKKVSHFTRRGIIIIITDDYSLRFAPAYVPFAVGLDF